MEITVGKVLVLEVIANEERKKNERGEYENTGRVFKKLILYPFGQTSFPGVLQAGFDDVREEEIKGILGKVCSVTLDQKATSKGTFYDFCSAVPLRASQQPQAA